MDAEVNHLSGLPEAEARLFMTQVDPPDGSWDEFWADGGRWATCWEEEDGTWVVHVNENPGGYLVCEWRLPPHGVWQDVEDGYDHEAERSRIATTPPKRAKHQEFLRGQTVYCVSWDLTKPEIWEATVVRYCGGSKNVQSYSVTHPKWGTVGVTRWKGGDYPTDIFGSRQEVEEFCRRVVDRTKQQ